MGESFLYFYVRHIFIIYVQMRYRFKVKERMNFCGVIIKTLKFFDKTEKFSHKKFFQESFSSHRDYI